MKPRLAFVVPGEPFPWERAGAHGYLDADGRPKVRSYTPGRSAEFETRVAHFTRAALVKTPEWRELALSDARFRVHIHFVTGQPRGDLDNFKKAVLDGMKKANAYRPELPRIAKGRLVQPKKVFESGVYRDDVRVTEGLVSIHRTKEKEPRTEILVEPATVLLEVPLWMQVAIENGWKPEMMQESVT